MIVHYDQIEDREFISEKTNEKINSIAEIFYIDIVDIDLVDNSTETALTKLLVIYYKFSGLFINVRISRDRVLLVVRCHRNRQKCHQAD